MHRLQPFAPDLWCVDGPVVSFLGFPYPTRMVVIRLPVGLWIWSPIALSVDLKAALAALGQVRFVVEPNHLHHLFLQPWLEEYPEAEAWLPPGLAPKLPELPQAATLGDTPPTVWAEWLDQVVLRGSSAMEEVVFFHRPSATAIVCDLVQRHDPQAFHGWRRHAMATDALLGPHGSTPREWRATFLRRGPAREALDRIEAWAPERLVIAHGECAARDGTAVLAAGLAWIRKPWPL